MSEIKKYLDLSGLTIYDGKIKGVISASTQSAITIANSAQTTANSALTAANSAQTTANSAVTAASSAQTTADSALTLATTINSYIASTTSATNKLVDQSTMETAIATETATFRGTYGLTTDLGLTIADAENEKAISTALKAKMTELSITPDKNDYTFVIIPAHSGATEYYNLRYDRYKFSPWTESGTTYDWAYEYSLNNSSFTTAQWNAINSNITSAKTAAYDAHIADTDIHVTTAQTAAWDAKVDFEDIYTKTELDSVHQTVAKALNLLDTGKADKSTTYTKTEVDNLIAEFTPITSTEIDALFA